MIEVDRRVVIEALSQCVEALSESVREPDRNWVVFFETVELSGQIFETVELSGQISYTYRTFASDCKTAEEAVRQGLRHLPRFDEPQQVRIREAHAVRSTDIASFNSSHFGEHQQFEMRW